MRASLSVSIALYLICATGAASGRSATDSAQTAGRGTIKGHIRLTGSLPGNAVIRMGMDPMCAKANAGKRVVQDVVVASPDGSLANVFVRLQGTLPQTPVPAQPLVIDQRACVYVPRVSGARVGQCSVIAFRCNRSC